MGTPSAILPGPCIDACASNPLCVGIDYTWKPSDECVLLSSLSQTESSTTGQNSVGYKPACNISEPETTTEHSEDEEEWTTYGTSCQAYQELPEREVPVSTTAYYFYSPAIVSLCEEICSSMPLCTGFGIIEYQGSGWKTFPLLFLP